MESKYYFVHINPWIGKFYGKGMYKSRILILGDSEYQTIPGQRESAEDTIWCIEQAILGKSRQAFFTNVATMMLGYTPSTEAERSHFWHSVAYYNFVQEQVGAGAGIPATPKMRREVAPDAFLEILRKYEPEFIIVLGLTNWSWLPEADAPGRYLPADPPSNNRDDIRQTYLYNTTPGHQALAVAVKHPSRAFSALEWHRWLLDGIPELVPRLAS